MRAAREEGLHDNGLIESRKFRVLTAEVENIYLTESEIRAIAEVDLKGDKQKSIARDIFLVGCYTAQRFSDYSTINEGNIRTLENGQSVIDLKCLPTPPPIADAHGRNGSPARDACKNYA